MSRVQDKAGSPFQHLSSSNALNQAEMFPLQGGGEIESSSGAAKNQDPAGLFSRTQIQVIDVVSTSEMIEFEDSLFHNGEENPDSGAIHFSSVRSSLKNANQAESHGHGISMNLSSVLRRPENLNQSETVTTSVSKGFLDVKGVELDPEGEEAKNHESKTDENELPMAIVPPPLTRKPSKTMSDFQLIKVLGRGAYGKVFLARHLDSHDILAMKVMHKRELFKRNVVTNIKSERLVLESITHPFIVKLRYAFQTQQKLYLLMNYVPGGELFTKLDRDRDMPESQVRFFAAEVALALDYLHSQNIIYRDLKPENVLFTADGHICLTDFGFARSHVESNTGSDSFCGTVQYMAPEVVSRAGHGKSADWWSFGCLIFEMLTTRTPFHHDNRNKLQEMILTTNPVYPKWISPSVKHLLKLLFNKDPNQRLDFAGVKAHPFFEGINWDKLIRKEVSSPFKPKLKNDIDTSNFDPRFTVEPVIDTPPSSPATRARIREERKVRREKREQEIAKLAEAEVETAANPKVPVQGAQKGPKKGPKKGKKQQEQLAEQPPSDSSDDETVGPLDPNAFDGFSFAGFSPYVPPLEENDEIPVFSICETSHEGDVKSITRSTAAIGLSPRQGATIMPRSLGFAPPQLLGTPPVRSTNFSTMRKNSDTEAVQRTPGTRDGLFMLPAQSPVGISSDTAQDPSPQGSVASASLATPRSAMRLHFVSSVPLMELDSSSSSAPLKSSSPRLGVTDTNGSESESFNVPPLPTPNKSLQGSSALRSPTASPPSTTTSTVTTNSSRMMNVAMHEQRDQHIAKPSSQVSTKAQRNEARATSAVTVDEQGRQSSFDTRKAKSAAPQKVKQSASVLQQSQQGNPSVPPQPKNVSGQNDNKSAVIPSPPPNSWASRAAGLTKSSTLSSRDANVSKPSEESKQKLQLPNKQEQKEQQKDIPAPVSSFKPKPGTYAAKLSVNAPEYVPSFGNR